MPVREANEATTDRIVTELCKEFGVGRYQSLTYVFLSDWTIAVEMYERRFDENGRVYLKLREMIQGPARFLYRECRRFLRGERRRWKRLSEQTAATCEKSGAPKLVNNYPQ